MIHSGTTAVFGTGTLSSSFEVPETGSYEVAVADIVPTGSPVFDPMEFVKVGLSECATCEFFKEFELSGAKNGSFGFAGDPTLEYFLTFAGKVVDGGVGAFGFDVSLVPIPASVVLLGSAVLGLVVVRRRIGGETVTA